MQQNPDQKDFGRPEPTGPQTTPPSQTGGTSGQPAQSQTPYGQPEPEPQQQAQTQQQPEAEQQQQQPTAPEQQAQQQRVSEARPKNIEAAQATAPGKSREKNLEELNIEQQKAYTSETTISPQQEMNPQSQVISAPSTQNYLDIEEIHNGVVILKNGGMRMVLMVSAVNFALKSEAEQNAIIYSFQNFLNSLAFPVQIVMQSRRLDLSAYIAQLKVKSKEESNALIRLQMTDYISFVEQLLTVANIMEKKFYVVIPYQPVIIKKEGLLAKISKIFSRGQQKTEIVDFEMHRKELGHRTEVVASGLGGAGLRAVQLNTLELAELYYSSYNPELATRQKIFSLGDITNPVVEKEESTNNQ